VTLLGPISARGSAFPARATPATASLSPLLFGPSVRGGRGVGGGLNRNEGT
jgi:hypothetical protein